MAPAVPRTLSVAELERIVRSDNSFTELIAQTDYVCGSGEFVK